MRWKQHMVFQSFVCLTINVNDKTDDGTGEGAGEETPEGTGERVGGGAGGGAGEGSVAVANPKVGGNAKKNGAKRQLRKAQGMVKTQSPSSKCRTRRATRGNPKKLTKEPLQSAPPSSDVSGLTEVDA